MTTDYRAELQRLVKANDDGDVEAFHQAVERARTALSQPEPEGPPLEPRGCPTPGACSCPTSPTVPPDLIRALELAEAALADIGDAEREPGDDLAWAEARAARDLLRIRAALARWGRLAVESEPEALTDEEILKISDQFDIDGIEDVTKGMSFDTFWDSYQPQQLIAFARAIIAADRARWGRNTTTKIP